MHIISACRLSLLLCVLFSGSPLHAAWEIRKIDTNTHDNSTRLKEDLAAYRKEGDLYLHRISSGVGTRVTHDSYDRKDSPLGLEQENLWYWARDPYTPVHDLHRYSVESGEDEWVFSFDTLIADNQGTADPGRVIIWKDHDWYLLENYSLARLTFSGEGLCKQQAWLTDDHLVWRAVCGAPGVYATHLSTEETVCVFADDVPPYSLCAAGRHAAWVQEPAPTRDEHTVHHYDLDTQEIRVLGTSEEGAYRQLAMEIPHLFWLKKEGFSWQVMRTNLEDETETCLLSSELSMNTIRVSDDNILLTTRNCRGTAELCTELNVLDQATGVLTQLTHFGVTSVIASPRIDTGGIAFTRKATAFPFINEVFVGSETPEPPGWGLNNAGDSDKAFNLALLLPPLAIAPWHRRLRHRLRCGPLS